MFCFNEPLFVFTPFDSPTLPSTRQPRANSYTRTFPPSPDPLARHLNLPAGGSGRQERRSKYHERRPGGGGGVGGGVVVVGGSL